jgi:hypothetical protein
VDERIKARIQTNRIELLDLELQARRLRDQADMLHKQADQVDLEMTFRTALIKELEELLAENDD